MRLRQAINARTLDSRAAWVGRVLRHKNSNVTRSVYRAHFSAKRRELLRQRMEARHGSTVEDERRAVPLGGDVVPLDRVT